MKSDSSEAAGPPASVPKTLPDAAPQKDRTTQMAEFIDKWLGNSATRGVLRRLTKRCPKCGRRTENALLAYATGKSTDMCLGCRFSRFLMSKALDSMIARTDISREMAKQHLADPMWRKGLASVLEGIAKYGPAKPFTAYAPFLVVWNISRLCNLKCRHCYEFADKPRPDELNTEQALAAVDKMADAGVAYIAVSGGEPLMRTDFFEVARRIHEKDMAFSIATNGTLLTKENVQKLKELNCIYVQVSVNGATPATHNWFRGVNAFEKTMQGIKNAVKHDLTVGISMTVTSHNYKEVPAAIELSERLGAQFFMHYNFIPTGRGKNIQELDITPQQRENLLKLLASQNSRRKIKLLSTAPQYSRVCIESHAATIAMTHFDYASPEMTESIRFLADFIGGCGTGRLYCALEPNGDIESCVFIPIRLGNIKTDDFLGVWHNNDVLKKLRDRSAFKANCGVCEFRNVCGGCRARAYAMLGDVQACDPGCVRNQESWGRLVKNV